MLKYSTYRSIYENQNEVRSGGQNAAAIGTPASSYNMVKWLESARTLLTEKGLKIVLLFVLVLAGLSLVGNVFAGPVSMAKEGKRVVVSSGDTLWEIASVHKPENMRTAVYIEGIKRANGLNGSEIRTGDILTLPVYD